MYQTIITTLQESILTILINRPDKLNALNTQVLKELSMVIEEVYNNNEIRAAVITGSGEKSFVAGADISEFLALEGTGESLARWGQELFFKIEQSPKPIIAAVNGFALGGGLELAMACHFRLASSNARFGQPEINLALIPGYGGTQRLTQLVGRGRAMELLLSAKIIDAEKALQYGLVNEVVPLQDLLPKCMEILTLINQKSPLAVSRCIRAANAASDSATNGYEVEAIAFGECFGTYDMKEGVQAFIEKRKPAFKGE